jgi:hypothetical protein
VSYLVGQCIEFGAQWLTKYAQKGVPSLSHELGRVDAYPPCQNEKAPHRGKVQRYVKIDENLLTTSKIPPNPTARSLAARDRTRTRGP